MTSSLAIRTGHRLGPDPRRVITKLFIPGEETASSRSRANAVIARVLALDDAEVTAIADTVIAGFRGRHRDLTGTFSQHFAVVAHEIQSRRRLSAERRMLIGACFTHEYAPEAAALCNPSMTSHPDQTGLAQGQLRFLMTVRCIGEGHLSSIGFRTGIVGPGTALAIDEPSPLLMTGSSRSATFQRRVFLAKLADLDDDPEIAQLLLGGLPEAFTASQLDGALAGVHTHTASRQTVHAAIEHIHDIAAATYDLEYSPETELAERLLWPTAPAESHGMEDARVVRFEEDDGTVTYLATYTAYDGNRGWSNLLATKDFQRFHVTPTTGRAAQTKGLAVFPRRIGGRYFALSRWDRENIALSGSDNYRIWPDPITLHAPRYGWELIQVGNCGSPIETPEGWLVLTHGVGPMRTYAMGALLLDLADPSVVLATLPEPILTVAEDERDGYVPNVVYSCGPLLHDGVLTIPYGISDGAIGFAQVELPQLLSRMVGPKH